jgi:predicted amidohydrolase YtcJ
MAQALDIVGNPSSVHAGGRAANACVEGARDAVAALAGPGTKRIDLGGRLALPAFNDSHQHLLPMGLGMGQVNLRAPAVNSLDALLTRIREAAKAAPKGGWIVGRGEGCEDGRRKGCAVG